MAQWESKLEALRAKGDEERVAMAVFSLEKVREKVKEKKEAIQQPDCSVRRMEGMMAAEAKVKEEEVEDEVVEVEVEAEEMVKETVKEEVEEKAVVGGQWLRVFLGTEDAGAIQDLPWDPAVLAGPHHPNPDPPGESGLDSPFFLYMSQIALLLMSKSLPISHSI